MMEDNAYIKDELDQLTPGEVKKLQLALLRQYCFEEYLWLSIAHLAEERGFMHVKARRQKDRTYLFTGGIPSTQLIILWKEIEAGGWTHLQTGRKRHFFQKAGSMFDNPSLCNKHHLTFYSSLDHDQDDADKCALCLTRYKRLKIKRTFAAGNDPHYYEESDGMIGAQTAAEQEEGNA